MKEARFERLHSVTFGKRKTVGTEIQSAVAGGLRVEEVHEGCCNGYMTKFVRIHKTLHLKYSEFYRMSIIPQ